MNIDKMEEDLKNKDIKNYFIDITYHLIPKKNYKLLTISGLNKKIIMQYSYINIFEMWRW